MARGFRFYEKKRGNRRTGSKTLGSAGEALFFAIVFLIGCLGMVVLFATLVIPEWRANHEFVRHTCLVRKTRLAEKKAGEGGALYRPEIQIEYQIKGETYRVWTYDLWTLNPDGGFSANKADQQAILKRFVPDPQRPYDCWYDAADPTTVVLVRGPHGWIWLTFIVPICFILIGGGGLVYTALNWGTSAERRAAFVKRAAELPAFDTGDRGKDEFPNIPDCAKITDSPGTTLAIRLPVAIAPVWGLLALLFTAVVWNSVVAVFMLWAINAHQGKPDWFLIAFVSPFVLIGIGLIAYFFRRLLIATGIGPTLVEISDHPLYPGQRYQLFVQQAGRLRLKSLQVLLVCEEEATYRHGTDTRTESRRVYQQPLFTQSSCEIQHGVPFEAPCEVEVPAGAMHSFKADHNEVNWKILVKGTVSRWPDFERSFPIIVHPSRNGKSVA